MIGLVGGRTARQIAQPIAARLAGTSLHRSKKLRGRLYLSPGFLLPGAPAVRLADGLQFWQAWPVNPRPGGESQVG
jgi:hypothetical protein